ncbi:MAG TPA: DUF5995 family protein [Herpetosiphonaceae bacterium]
MTNPLPPPAPTSRAVTLPLEVAYTSLDEAFDGLATIERIYRQQRDRRAIFVTAYLVITGAIRRSVAEQRFADNDWAARYAISFANLYRQALLDFERQDLAAVPKAWRIAFETASGNHSLALQDLLLGINAHINHDLPLALAEVTIDPDRDRCYADHNAVNLVLRAAVDQLQQQICRVYAPILTVLDLAGGDLDEELAGFSVAKARESAWVAAVSLANARSDAERTAIRTSLNDRAAVMARLVLSPNPIYPWLVGALRHLENLKPWYDWIEPSVPHPNA